MDFIQTSNKAVDLYGSGRHGFAAGNPGAGVPATFLSPAWCNAVQMELMNIVLAGGLVPSGADLSQVLQALTALFRTAAQVTAAINAQVPAIVTTGINAQVPALITAAFTGSNQSLTANGFQNLPGGLRLKWGSVAVGNLPAPPAWSTLSVVFPTAFPALCLGFIPTLVDANGTTVAIGQLGSALSAAGASVQFGEFSASAQDLTMLWFALGY